MVHWLAPKSNTMWCACIPEIATPPKMSTRRSGTPYAYANFDASECKLGGAQRLPCKAVGVGIDNFYSETAGLPCELHGQADCMPCLILPPSKSTGHKR